MKDLIFALDSFPGPTAGTEAQFWLLHRLLTEKAGAPRVVTLRFSGFLAERLGDRYECLEIGSLLSPVAWWKALKLAYLARRDGVRVAHLFLNDVSVLLPLFFALFGIKVIVSRRDLGFWYSRAILAALKAQRLFVKRVIANCDAVQSVVRKKEGYPAAKVDVILNGYERPARIDPLRLREQHRIPPDALLLGMVANLRPLKRIEDAIWALGVLENLGIKAWLVVAGADVQVNGHSQQETLTRLAERFYVSDRVIFLGPVQSSWSLLTELDVFLSCSSTEGLSNSIIEAMASGVPVVASAVGGTPAVITDEKSGLLYPAGDLHKLVTAILILAKSPEYRQHLAEEALVFAEENLSAPALLAAHERLYGALLREYAPAKDALPAAKRGSRAAGGQP